MGLTRKRKRELNRLKGHAEELWDDQKEILENASVVVREASRQAANFAREEVSPRVRETLDERVKPAVTTGVNATRHAASSAKEKFDDFLPQVSSALGSALAVLEVAKDPRVRDVVRNVSASSKKVGHQLEDVSAKVSKSASKASKAAGKAATKAAVSAHLVKKQKSGAGRYFLIGIIVVAVGAVAYAAYQTLRADDDLWIDEEEVPEQEAPKPVDDAV
ncbi:hypothetical protein [Glaciihabitans sp. dw_435]|uniref:hypothetical protein n=1 Tax=Glaciihabitans sp. dw_435 TaxID=2720081 RepID=UPI001BD5780E|nr:hypothetical protein [Glaciihabitans sp. dw_435]